MFCPDYYALTRNNSQGDLSMQFHFPETRLDHGERFYSSFETIL